MEVQRTPWAMVPSKVCLGWVLINSLTFTQDTISYYYYCSPFFLFKADKLHQVFPSYLDTKIKSRPNYWLWVLPGHQSQPLSHAAQSQAQGRRLSFQELGSASWRLNTAALIKGEKGGRNETKFQASVSVLTNEYTIVKCGCAIGKHFYMEGGRDRNPSKGSK